MAGLVGAAQEHELAVTAEELEGLEGEAARQLQGRAVGGVEGFIDVTAGDLPLGLWPVSAAKFDLEVVDTIEHGESWQLGVHGDWPESRAEICDVRL